MDTIPLINAEKIFYKIGNNNLYQLVIFMLFYLINGTIDIFFISYNFLNIRPIGSWTNMETGIHHTDMELSWYACEKDNYTINWQLTRNSLVIDYNIFCNRKETDFLLYSNLLGAALGSLLYYIFSDKYGRKIVLVVNLFAFILITIGLYFNENLGLLYTLLVFSGIVTNTIKLTIYVYFVEIIRFEFIAIYMSLLYSSDSFFGIVYTLIYSNFDNYRLMFLILGMIQLLFICLSIVYLEESPRFYLMRYDFNNYTKSSNAIARKNKKAKIIMEDLNINTGENMLITPDYKQKKSLNLKRKSENNNNIIKINNKLKNYITYDNINPFETSQDKIDQNKSVSFHFEDIFLPNNYSVLDFFRNSSQKMNFLLMNVVWLGTSIVYTGCHFKIYDILPSTFLDYLIIFSFDIVLIISVGFISNSITGRKLSIIILFFVCITFFLCGVFFDLYHNSVYLIFILSGRISIVGIYTIINFYTCEIYPTNIRAIGLGVNEAVYKIFQIVTLVLMSYFTIITNLIIMVFICIISIIAAFKLPETNNKPLQENIPEELEGEDDDNFDDENFN